MRIGDVHRKKHMGAKKTAVLAGFRGSWVLVLAFCFSALVTC